MTSAQRRHCMRLLDRARTGDERACDELVRAISEYFGYLIKRYRAPDPAYDSEDLTNQFRLAVWQAIPKVDGRGDPLYHLAWRGQQAVRSLLAMAKSRRQGTEFEQRTIGQPVSVGCWPEGWDPPETRSDYDPVSVVDRLGAEQQLAGLLERVKLTPNQRDLMARVVNDLRHHMEGEEGANLRIARRLDISPQAASSRRRALLETLSGTEHSVAVMVSCEACGRGFRSKGALTQHIKGQSGHKPCPALMT